MMTYKNYVGVVEFDDEAGVIRGRIAESARRHRDSKGRRLTRSVGPSMIRWTITSNSARSTARSPREPFNGKILVRVKPEIHRSLSDQAAARGVGLNDLIASHLESLATLGPEGIGHRTSDVPTAIDDGQGRVEPRPPGDDRGGSPMRSSRHEAEAEAVRIAKAFVASKGAAEWTCGGLKPERHGAGLQAAKERHQVGRVVRPFEGRCRRRWPGGRAGEHRDGRGRVFLTRHPATMTSAV